MQHPELRTPAGACDCHIHIYEDRFPAVPQAVFKPPHAPLADYLDVRKALGLSRVVVVQPNGYGYDNTCTLEAMAALGDTARGVAIVPPDTPDAELERLTRAGVRGIRYFLLPGGILGWDSLETMAARVRNFGWHVQLQLDGRELPRYEEALARLPVQLVIDHNGKFLDPVPTSHPGFQSLVRLLRTGNTWVKLSAPYETSKAGPPHYADVSALARALVAANPERCVWATNWPHPAQNPRPESAPLLDLLLEWADDDVTRHRILVDNPARLYGFPARSTGL
ncbi:MAG: amidohydrolase family protein [Burkholderiales bacterium]|nr:amidohydrolase family protein [Burkholderiales bacterium]